MTLLNNQGKLDSLILESMYSELQSMQERLQNSRRRPTRNSGHFREIFSKTVMGKLETAIAAVAKQKDLIYVFDISGRNPIYTSDKSIDVGPMVKEKLGIQ